jgi:shikimate dehydrogenase
LLALVGHPVEHSLSPAMHNASFAAEGLDYVYVALDVKPEDLPSAVRGAAALGFRGFNVTMPHKRAILPLLDDVDEGARISGAVNTVVVEDVGLLRGHNTDGGGMVGACREAGIGLAGKRVLLLGAGGVAAAIALAFSLERIGELRIVNRSIEPARELLGKLRGAGLKKVEVTSGDALGEAAKTEVIVNATSLGMRDGDPLPIPVEHLGGGRTVCDAVYRPGGETALIREARVRGARVVAGERMLLYQGVLAQRFWTGREPNVKAMDGAIPSRDRGARR